MNDNNGLFGQMTRNDAYMMPPVGIPPQTSEMNSQQAQIDALNAQQQQATPSYVGDPVVDKYIHMFIGGGI